MGGKDIQGKMGSAQDEQLHQLQQQADIETRSSKRLGLVADPNSIEGPELLSTVASLTGLPEPLISEELRQILCENGHETESLTLEQLRHALLGYLESMREGFDFEEESLADSSNMTLPN